MAAPTMTTAAAGVRDSAGAGLQCSGELTDWLGSLLEAPGAYQYPKSEQEKLGSTGLPVMADGGLGFMSDEARGRNRAGEDGGNDQ